MKQIKNNQKSIGESVSAYGFKKSQDFCQMLVISKQESRTLRKKSIRLGYGFKNLYKIYSLTYGFLFFVIPSLKKSV